MLSISIDGADPVPAQSVVIFESGKPIAAALYHGNVVIWADAARDTGDLVSILESLGVPAVDVHRNHAMLVRN